MPDDDFDWDAHMAKAPYNTVLKGMRVARKLIPSMLSPDRKLVFLATYDLAFPTDQPDTLKARLEEVYEQLQRVWESRDTSSEEIYRNEVDYRLLWHLLSELSAVPEAHEDPDDQLRKIFKGKTAAVSSSR